MAKSEFGTIYVLRNKINGKMYVGQTIHDFKYRLANHKISEYPIGKAIRKYGIDNFDTIIYSGIHINFLDFLEQKLIDRMNTVSPTGYNIQLGGQVVRKFSEETRKKMSLARLGKPPSNKGMPRSEETKQKLRIAQTGKKASEETRKKLSNLHLGNKYNAGKKLSEKTKMKMRKGHSYKAVKVKNIDTDEIFESIRDAMRKYPKSNSIHKVYKYGGFSGGFHWISCKENL